MGDALSKPAYGSREEQRDLIALAQAGDEQAKEQLVQNNMALVNSLVQRFGYGNIEREDLLQIGVLGLIKAINGFDLNFDTAFSTYAVPRIMGEIRRSLRDDNPVYVCRSVKELAAAAARERRAFQQLHNREPSLKELALKLTCTPHQISEAICAMQTPTSLQNQLSEDGGELADLIAVNVGEEHWLTQISLQDSLNCLPPRLSYVLRQRYFAEQTQGQIAANLGVSQVQVSRMEKQALERLQTLLKE